VAPEVVDAVRRAWSAKGIPSYVLGRFDRAVSKSTVRRNGRVTALPEPDIDPFWDLFFAGLTPS
jgi:hypothetical protein